MTDVIEKVAMTLETLKALEARLVAATGPDRELDGDICVVLDGGGEIVWLTQNYIMERYPARRISRSNYVGGFANEHVPLFTASNDAIIALIERAMPHYEITLELYRDRDNEWFWRVVLTNPKEPPEGESHQTVRAIVPHSYGAAIPACLALVRAMIEREEK